ncbi:MAG: hypothetical protein AABZ15_02925 [Nitrospirota bacterium]
MMRYLVVLLCLAAPAAANVRTAEPPPAWLKSVSCRIFIREGGASVTLRPLNDGIVDTLSKNSVDHTMNAVITGGRMLGAKVQHVYVKMPKERFNVAMTLDGTTYLRMNHLDLDIFLETSIDGHVYILHCFQETQ